jgi:hypothetical protein
MSEDKTETFKVEHYTRVKDPKTGEYESAVITRSGGEEKTETKKEIGEKLEKKWYEETMGEDG